MGLDDQVLPVVTWIFFGAWLTVVIVAAVGYASGLFIERSRFGKWAFDPRRWRWMDCKDE